MKNLSDWGTKDIMLWICEEYSRDNRDFEKVPLREFANVTVKELRNMTRDDFFDILSCYDSANFLYKRKENLFRLNDSDGKFLCCFVTLEELF